MNFHRLWLLATVSAPHEAPEQGLTLTWPFLVFLLHKLLHSLVTSVTLLVSCCQVNKTPTSKLNVLLLVLLPVRKRQESQLRTNISFLFPSLAASKYLSDVSMSFMGQKPASCVLLQTILDRSSRDILFGEPLLLAAQP